MYFLKACNRFSIQDSLKIISNAPIDKTITIADNWIAPNRWQAVTYGDLVHWRIYASIASIFQYKLDYWEIVCYLQPDVGMTRPRFI